MVRPLKDIYIFPADGNGSFATVSEGVALEQLVSTSLANLLLVSDDYTNGLQLVRLRLGDTTIVAHKRMRDIKVTITRYNHYE